MKLALFVSGALMVGSMAFAADQENKASTEVDHSKNVITGTETTKKTTKKKMKDAHGNMAEKKTTETTKVHKDGKVEKEVESETESTSK